MKTNPYLLVVSLFLALGWGCSPSDERVKSGRGEGGPDLEDVRGINGLDQSRDLEVFAKSFACGDGTPVKRGEAILERILNLSDATSRTNWVDILTNVYVRARMVYSACGEWDADVEDRFSSVRPGGLQNELEPAEWSAFSNLCAVVSNSYGTILQDWGSYSTNELVRFTVLNAVAYSGENVYTNFFDRFMANCELSQRVAALPDITYLCSPFGTPLEEYTALHYDDEIVSNLLVRAAVFAENHGGTNLLVGCRQRISGAAKQYYLENR